MAALIRRRARAAVLADVLEAPLAVPSAALVRLARASRSRLARSLRGTTDAADERIAIEALTALARADGDPRHELEELLRRRTRRRNGEAWLLRCLAAVRAKRGALALANETLARAEAATTDPFELEKVAFLRAEVLGSERRVEESLTEIAALEASPRVRTEPAALFLVLARKATALRLLGRPEEAFEVARQALDTHPSTDVHTQRLRLEVALTHIDRLEFAEAHRLLRAIRTTDPELRLRHGFALAEMALHSRSPDAFRRFQRLAATAARLGFASFQAYFLYDAVFAALARSDFETAERVATEAARLAKTMGLRSVEHGSTMLRIATLALGGRVTEALSAMRRTAAPRFDRTADAFGHGVRAVIYAAVAEAVEPERRPPFLRQAAVERERFEERGSEGVRYSEASIFTRFVATLLGRRDDSDEVVTVATDGTWLRVSTERPVDLRRRPTLMRILARLAEHPARPDELIAAGWPGDRSSRHSLGRRLRVALFSLRRSGLGRRLVHRAGRYALDPSVSVGS